MATWNAIYMHGEVPTGFRPDDVGTCPIRHVSGWVELQLPGVDDGESTALALSTQVPGQVIWVLIQTSADVMSVMHCEDGQVRRCIVFEEHGWTRVEGAPEPWEAWLFSDEELEAAKESSDEEDDTALLEAFARKTLRVGDALPQPRAWGMLMHTLGMTEAELDAARAASVIGSVEGRKVSKLAVFARATLLGGVACLFGAIMSLGRARADWLGFAFALMFLAFGAGFIRRSHLGRWFL
ncbi:hypothetical protein [Myxococcus sp. Y35]|uniref:hypothetical protein n=1 Tax=Pseudomyxococcus flavus TaxID=3115648 RepID=UPI003CE7A812